MREISSKIECLCHRCKYVWQYRGNSKFIASCPRCKMTVYIPKMLRLLKENRSKSGTSHVDEAKRILDVRSDSSMTSSQKHTLYE